MKKVALSSAVIIAFILYGLHQRSLDQTTVVIAPKDISVASPSAEPSPTVAPTSTSTPTPTPSALPTVSAISTSTPVPTRVATPVPTPVPTPTPTPTPTGKYKNGTYTGSVADASWGNVQVQAVIQGGKITAVNFLQYPNDRSNSIRINTQAMPYLQQEAIQAQSAQVNIVSRATDTSMAFMESLTNALSQAQ